MTSKEYRMSDKNLIDMDVNSFTDLDEKERKNLELVFTELRGWSQQDVDMVISVMAEDAVYWDVTFEPAVGHKGIREFGDGWVNAVPNFRAHIESFVVQGDYVVDMGRILGTIKGEYFGLPATGKSFDCAFCQLCYIENGKIKYVRDHWNAATMYNQVGWDCSKLNE